MDPEAYDAYYKAYFNTVLILALCLSGGRAHPAATLVVVAILVWNTIDLIRTVRSAQCAT